MLEHHTLSRRRKTAAAFGSRVLISTTTSPSLDMTLPRYVEQYYHIFNASSAKVGEGYVTRSACLSVGGTSQKF